LANELFAPPRTLRIPIDPLDITIGPVQLKISWIFPIERQELSKEINSELLSMRIHPIQEARPGLRQSPCGVAVDRNDRHTVFDEVDLVRQHQIKSLASMMRFRAILNAIIHTRRLNCLSIRSSRISRAF
jgi:hypothetical protein